MILRGTSKKFEYLGKNETKNETLLTHWSAAQAGSNDEKNWGSKISLDCPFKTVQKHDRVVIYIDPATLLPTLHSRCPLFWTSKANCHLLYKIFLKNYHFQLFRTRGSQGTRPPSGRRASRTWTPRASSARPQLQWGLSGKVSSLSFLPPVLSLSGHLTHKDMDAESILREATVAVGAFR